MSLKEKAQRNSFLWDIICSVLVQTLAKGLALAPQPQMRKEQKGSTRALALQQRVGCSRD